VLSMTIVASNVPNLRYEHTTVFQEVDICAMVSRVCDKGKMTPGHHEYAITPKYWLWLYLGIRTGIVRDDEGSVE
jgi:hypothetical protein